MILYWFMETSALNQSTGMSIKVIIKEFQLQRGGDNGDRHEIIERNGVARTMAIRYSRRLHYWIIFVSSR